ncbi:MAG: hypothetical protein HC905_08600 [Bacteroidales bacterium]|nr:hypothetical protein [Bacteroidales bacterium]
MGNALKFTHAGNVDIVIGCSYSPSDKSRVDVYLEVSDTGIGISPAQTERIFDAFHQQEGQSTRKYGGTGLGLTITKRLVEMMNGTIEVKSVPNEGSVFKVSFNNVVVSTVRCEQLSDMGDTEIPAESYISKGYRAARRRHRLKPTDPQ